MNQKNIRKAKEMKLMNKKIVLTGDRPTGRLHLVGSLS